MSPVAIHPARPDERVLDENAIQPPPRGPRKLALVVFLIIAALPPLLIFIPWRQNIASEGSVVAFHPRDRMQHIPAPVNGRIVKIHVREGSRVKEGELLIEMADLDDKLQRRLEDQVSFARDKLAAARAKVDRKEGQITAQILSNQNAISIAQFELGMAEQKVLGIEQALGGARAKLFQLKEDVERQESLEKKGVKSLKVAQKARADYEFGKAKVVELEAKLEEGRQDVAAKRSKIEKIRNDNEAKLESIRSDRDAALGDVALADKELTEANSKLQKQSTQEIKAKRDGVILRIHGASSADYIKVGQKLIDFVPDTDNLAVELYVKGNDAPLVTPGSPVRINFEGWPAIQFVAWPSAAQGTFGGIVNLVDAQDDGRGNFRILVTPDPDDDPWPDQPYLRQGGRAKGWVLLREVSLGYELWRQLNGFPPALKDAPSAGKSGKEK
jgi:multidrug resistance efflux pump